LTNQPKKWQLLWSVSEHEHDCLRGVVEGNEEERIEEGKSSLAQRSGHVGTKAVTALVGTDRVGRTDSVLVQGSQRFSHRGPKNIPLSEIPRNYFSAKTSF